MEILAKACMNYIYKSKIKPGKHKKIVGLDNLDQIRLLILVYLMILEIYLQRQKKLKC